MSVKKVFINAKGMIFLLCPFCGENSEQPAKQFPVHQPVSISCSCGKTHEFQIETRKDFRKPTSLEVFYWKLDSPDKFQKATLVDLSLDGFCLCTSGEQTLQSNDLIRVNFKLDNERRTKIDREARVCWIMGNKIGFQFTVTPPYDPKVGFYIREFTGRPL
jgi:hypothetical protein